MFQPYRNGLAVKGGNEQIVNSGNALASDNLVHLV